MTRSGSETEDASAAYYAEDEEHQGYDEAGYYDAYDEGQYSGHHTNSHADAGDEMTAEEAVAENLELKALVTEQEREREELQAEVAALRRELKLKQRQLEKGAEASADAEDRFGDLSAALASLQEEVQEQSARLAEAEATRRAADARAREAVGELRECEGRLEEAEAVRVSLEDRLAASEGDADHLQQMLQRVRNEQSQAPAAPTPSRRTSKSSPDGAGLRQLKEKVAELELALADESQARREADMEAMRVRAELAERELLWECRTERSATPDHPPRRGGASGASRGAASAMSSDPMVSKELPDMTAEELSNALSAYTARIAHLEAQRRDLQREMHTRDPESHPDPDAAKCPSPKAPRGAGREESGEDEGPPLDGQWLSLCHWMRGRLGAQVSLKELRKHVEAFAPKRMRAQSPATTRANSRLCSPTPFRASFRHAHGAASLCGESSVGPPIDEQCHTATTPRALFNAAESNPSPRSPNPMPRHRPRRCASEVSSTASGPTRGGTGRAYGATPRELRGRRSEQDTPVLTGDFVGRGRRNDDSASVAASEARGTSQGGRSEYTETMRDAARERGRKAYMLQKEQRQVELQRKLQELRQPLAQDRTLRRPPSPRETQPEWSVESTAPHRRPASAQPHPVLVAARTMASPGSTGGGHHRAPLRGGYGEGARDSPAHLRHTQRTARHALEPTGPAIHYPSPGPSHSAFKCLVAADPPEPPARPQPTHSEGPLWRRDRSEPRRTFSGEDRVRRE
eukprot:Hpha_TRINITY_DN12334_c0_g1::TRINITY_DN12334_c0_g1_i1::g.155834::m.155834